MKGGLSSTSLRAARTTPHRLPWHRAPVPSAEHVPHKHHAWLCKPGYMHAHRFIHSARLSPSAYIDVDGLRETLYTAVQNCPVEPTEYYPIHDEVRKINPRDVYLSLRARSPLYTQRLPLYTLLTLFTWAVDHSRDMPTLPQLVLDDILVMGTWDPEAMTALETALEYYTTANYLNNGKALVIPNAKILDVYHTVCRAHPDVDLPLRNRETLQFILAAILQMERYDAEALRFIQAAYPLIFNNGSSAGYEEEVLGEDGKEDAESGDEGKEDAQAIEDVPDIVPGDTDEFKPAPGLHWGLQLIQQLTTFSHHELALKIFQHLVQNQYIPEAAMVQPVTAQAVHDATAPDFTDMERFTFFIVGTLVKTCMHFGLYDMAHAFMRSMQANAIFDPTYRAATTSVVKTLLLSGMEKDAELLCGLITAWAQDCAATQPLPDELIWILYDFCSRVKRPDLLHFIYERFTSPLMENAYPLPQNFALVQLLKYCDENNRVESARALIRSIVEHNFRIHPTHRSDIIIITISMGFSREAHQLYLRYHNSRDVSMVYGNAAVASRLIRRFVGLAKKKERDGDEEMAKEHRDFAQLVLKQLLHYKMPLENQDHFSITTIAHCHFLLEQLDEGFRAQRAILNRQEVPTQTDVTVLLTAAAKYSPRAAMGLLENVRKEDLEVGALTYSSLLHQALAKNDTELADDIFRRAIDEGVAHELGHKGLNAVARALLYSILPPGARHPHMPKVDPKAGPILERVLFVLDTAHSTNVKVDIDTGQRAVRTALASGHPHIAFKFWDRFVRGKVNTDESNHRSQAGEATLIKEVRRAIKEGRLDMNRGIAMLGRLTTEGLLKGVLRAKPKPGDPEPVDGEVPDMGSLPHYRKAMPSRGELETLRRRHAELEGRPTNR